MDGDGGDRFGQARALLLALWGLAALVVIIGVMAALAGSDHDGDPRPGLVRALGLTTLTVTPTGRPPRPPEPPAAVDLRFDPSIPLALDPSIFEDARR
jgi:hypothetical protein